VPGHLAAPERAEITPDKHLQAASGQAQSERNTRFDARPRGSSQIAQHRGSWIDERDCYPQVEPKLGRVPK
jgi:hypothetical protein